MNKFDIMVKINTAKDPSDAVTLRAKQTELAFAYDDLACQFVTEVIDVCLSLFPDNKMSSAIIVEHFRTEVHNDELSMYVCEPYNMEGLYETVRMMYERTFTQQRISVLEDCYKSGILKIAAYIMADYLSKGDHTKYPMDCFREAEQTFINVWQLMANEIPFKTLPLYVELKKKWCK